MGILTGDYGHEDRYVNGAAAQGGRYSTTKHVAAQCRDSDAKNSKPSKAASAAKGLGKALDWLGR